MSNYRAHIQHFESHIKLMFSKFSRFIITKRMFEGMGIKPKTFSFAGYQTLYFYNENGILFYTKPMEIIIHGQVYSSITIDESGSVINSIPFVDFDDPRWLPCIEKIEKFVDNGCKI